MQLVVADEAHPIEAEARLAQRRFGRSDQRVPVELDHALALAPADQHVEALHRHEEFERLDPIDGDAQRVVVAQVVELGAVFALDGRDPQRLAPAVGLRLFSVRSGERRKRLSDALRRSS